MGLLSIAHTGFEPVISSMSMRRPLQAGPMGNIYQSIRFDLLLIDYSIVKELTVGEAGFEPAFFSFSS